MCFFIIIIVKVSHTSNSNYAKIKPLHVFVHAHERHSSVEVSFMPTYIFGKKPPLKHQYLNWIKPRSAECFFCFCLFVFETGPQQIVQSTPPFKGASAGADLGISKSCECTTSLSSNWGSTIRAMKYWILDRRWNEEPNFMVPFLGSVEAHILVLKFKFRFRCVTVLEYLVMFIFRYNWVFLSIPYGF